MPLQRSDQITQENVYGKKINARMNSGGYQHIENKKMKNSMRESEDKRLEHLNTFEKKGL